MWRSSLRSVFSGIAAGLSIALPSALLLGWLGGPEIAVRWLWYVNRSAGIVAYLLLSASVTLGLVTSIRALDGIAPRGVIVDVHQFLSAAGLLLAAVHAGVPLLDDYVRFSWVELLIPFAARYKPILSGIGTLALYLTAIVHFSFHVQKRLPRGLWRKLHGLSFVAFALALAHGYWVGTDTAIPLVRGMYAGTGLLVALLAGYRGALGLVQRARRSAALKRA